MNLHRSLNLTFSTCTNTAVPGCNTCCFQLIMMQPCKTNTPLHYSVPVASQFYRPSHLGKQFNSLCCTFTNPACTMGCMTNTIIITRPEQTAAQPRLCRPATLHSPMYQSAHNTKFSVLAKARRCTLKIHAYLRRVPQVSFSNCMPGLPISCTPSIRTHIHQTTCGLAFSCRTFL